MRKLLKFSLGGLVVVIFLIGGILFASRQSDSPLGSRTNQPERTLFTTSTNANFSGIAVANVNDFNNIGFTAVTENASGTLRIACSMQDTQPTIGAATSTSNRWDYVDIVDAQNEASLDGYTGITFSGGNLIRQVVVRNSVFKWCSALLSGNTSPAGLGTTTVYMKPVANQ